MNAATSNDAQILLAAGVGLVAIGVLWLVAISILRRLAPRFLPHVMNVFHFAFALFFNFCIFFVSLVLVSDGLGIFMHRSGFLSGGEAPETIHNPFARFFMDIGNTVNGTGGHPIGLVLPKYLLGFLISMASILLAHYLMASVVNARRWVSGEREADFEVWNMQHGERVARMERRFRDSSIFGALVVSILAFYIVVWGFDTLISQIHLSDMVGLQQKNGVRLPPWQIKDPAALLREHPHLLAAKIVVMLRYVYVVILLFGAYLSHTAWSAWLGLANMGALVADTRGPPAVPDQLPVLEEASQNPELPGGSEVFGPP